MLNNNLSNSLLITTTTFNAEEQSVVKSEIKENIINGQSIISNKVIYESDIEINEILNSIKDVDNNKNIKNDETNDLFPIKDIINNTVKKEKNLLKKFISKSFDNIENKKKIKKIYSDNNFYIYESNFDIEILKNIKFPEIITKNKEKINFSDKKSNKIKLINLLFSEKKKISKKFQLIDKENSPDKKSAKLKNFNLIQKKDDKEIQIESKKREFLENQSKTQKYKKMKLKKLKKEDEIIDEREERIKCLQSNLLVNASKITIKTFLWVKTVIRPHIAVFKISAAILALFYDNVKLDPENWKKIQTYFISPTEILNNIYNFQNIAKGNLIKEGFKLIFIKSYFSENLQNSQNFLKNFDENLEDIKDTKIYLDFIKNFHDFLTNFYEYFCLINFNLFKRSEITEKKKKDSEENNKIKQISFHLKTECSPSNNYLDGNRRFFSPVFKKQKTNCKIIDNEENKEEIYKNITKLKKEISKIIWNEERRVKQINEIKEKNMNSKSTDFKNKNFIDKKTVVEQKRKEIREKFLAQKKENEERKLNLKDKNNKTKKTMNKKPLKNNNPPKNVYQKKENKENEKKIIKFEKEITEKAKEV